MNKPIVALLIDWENIKYSTINHLGSPPDIITLKKIARQYGKIGVARAYANWSDLGHEGEMERFSLQSIEPVFVQTRRYKEDTGSETIKGSVDIRLACDCIELLVKNSEISTFVLASSDAGFAHIINKIKVYGKQAISIGIRAATGASMGIVSDELIFYDDWTVGLRVGPNDQEVSKALKEFVRAVEDIRTEKSNNSLQAVKLHMLKRNPDFNEEKIGIPTFRHLAYLAEMERLIKVDSTSEPANAYIPEDTKTDDGFPLYPGIKWKVFIQALKPNVNYAWGILQEVIKKNNIYVDDGDVKEFLENAKNSAVLWPKKLRLYNKEKDQTYPVTQYFLNMNHPKVQVYRTGELQSGQNIGK